MAIGPQYRLLEVAEYRKSGRQISHGGAGLRFATGSIIAAIPRDQLLESQNQKCARPDFIA
jgi:hypothetical protein